MNNPFSQSKVTYKISFSTYFKFLTRFEEIINNNYEDILLGMSTQEEKSSTIDSQEDDIWQLEAYFSQKPELIEIKKLFEENLETPKLIILNDLSLEIVEDQDWVSIYQASLIPIEIGEFFISSKIHRDMCPNNKTGIYIEASRAFGTGEHDTTSGCIEALINLTPHKFENIIDIGTGTGILSLVAKHLWPHANILGCDIEEVAVDISKDNAKYNNLEVEFYQNIEDKILNESNKNRKFDLLVSNILAGPLINLAPQIKELAQEDAMVILSGFLNNQSEEVLACYKENGCELYSSIYKNSWVIFILKVKEN